MILNYLDKALWAASFVGQIALLFVLLYRRRLRTFPWFTLSIGLAPVITILLFVLYRFSSSHAYTIAYWTTELLQLPVTFLVVLEVAKIQLAPLAELVKEYRSVFWKFGIPVVLTFCLVSMGTGMGVAKGIDLWENRITVFTSLTICFSLLVLSAVLSRFYILPRQHSAAVAKGYFFLQYAVLLSDLVKAFYGLLDDPSWSTYSREFLYLGVLVFWIISFWRDEKPPSEPPLEVRQLLFALHDEVKYDLEKLGRRDQ